MLRVIKYNLSAFWLVLFCAVLLFSSCKSDSAVSTETSTASSQAENKGFAIYLTKNDIPPILIESINDITLADEPLISIEDVISYDAQTHEILLTDEAYLCIEQLDVPVNGKSFIVCVNGAPQYSGAFWTPISSVSFSGIIIDKPFPTEGPKTIRIAMGYPGKDFYQGDDPRNNQEIFEVLENAGKLINKP